MALFASSSPEGLTASIFAAIASGLGPEANPLPPEATPPPSSGTARRDLLPSHPTHPPTALARTSS